jgi:hypothetical protein
MKYILDVTCSYCTEPQNKHKIERYLVMRASGAKGVTGTTAQFDVIGFTQVLISSGERPLFLRREENKVNQYGLKCSAVLCF